MLLRAQEVERIMVWVRWIAIPFALWQIYTYYLPTPTVMMWLALIGVVLLALGNTVLCLLHRRYHDPADVQRLSWASMVFDALLITIFVTAYTFDPNSTAYVLYYILPLEAAARFGAKQAFYTMGAVAIVYTIQDIISSQYYDHPYYFSTLTFRIGVGFLLTTIAGALSTSWRRERKRVQDLYEQTQEQVIMLQESDELRGNFLSAVAHDMRTPLTVIMGFAMLLRNRSHSLSENEEMMVDNMIAESKRLHTMLEDLLDINRLSKGEVSAQIHEIDIKATIDRVITRYRASHEAPIIDYSDPLIAYLDETHIERILENLLGNALKYAEPNSSRPIEVGASLYEDGVILQVSDYGPGVPDEYKESIFQPFKRGSLENSNYQPGTGVGLSLVAQLAKLYGGRAWVTDREGASGACFHVYLPEKRVIPSPV
jgi:signal transduction histidine kinase